MPLLVKNLLFTSLLPGTVAVYLPLIIASGRGITSVRPLLAVGFFLLGIGATTFVLCLWDFASFGRGTPFPADAPRKLVMRGLYRYTRNPMYLGVITVVLGWSALFAMVALAAYAAFVATAFHLFVVLYEERRLRSQFGTEYDAYRRVVNRWLPRLRGTRADGGTAERGPAGPAAGGPGPARRCDRA